MQIDHQNGGVSVISENESCCPTFPFTADAQSERSWKVMPSFHNSIPRAMDTSLEVGLVLLLNTE